MYDSGQPYESCGKRTSCWCSPKIQKLHRQRKPLSRLFKDAPHQFPVPQVVIHNLISSLYHKLWFTNSFCREAAPRPEHCVILLWRMCASRWRSQSLTSRTQLNFVILYSLTPSNRYTLLIWRRCASRWRSQFLTFRNTTFFRHALQPHALWSLHTSYMAQVRVSLMLPIRILLAFGYGGMYAQLGLPHPWVQGILVHAAGTSLCLES